MFYGKCEKTTPAFKNYDEYREWVMANSNYDVSYSNEEDSQRSLGNHYYEWPPKIRAGTRDTLSAARTNFKNRVDPASQSPSGQKRKKNSNRLGQAGKDSNDYDGCLDCLPKKNRMKFSSPHKEKAEKTNRDTNPDPDQCLDCPDDPKPALPKEVTELQNRVGNLEKRVGDLEKVNVTSSTSTSSSTPASTTLENVHPR